MYPLNHPYKVVSIWKLFWIYMGKIKFKSFSKDVILHWMLLRELYRLLNFHRNELSCKLNYTSFLHGVTCECSLVITFQALYSQITSINFNTLNVQIYTMISMEFSQVSFLGKSFCAFSVRLIAQACVHIKSWADLTTILIL